MIKMENYSINEMLRASHVKRWHTVDTVKDQSVAEHQWNVTALSMRIASIAGEEITAELVQYAMFHDLEEIYTGDMPSPYKERCAAREATGDTHNRGVGTPIAGISLASEDGSPVRRGTYHNTGIDTIVRAADLIDAWQWSTKYVLDAAVAVDCWDRMHKYKAKCRPRLELAMDEIIREISTLFGGSY